MICFVIFCNLSIAQSFDENTTPNGMMEYVFDNSGNKFKLKDISISPKISVRDSTKILESTLLCTSGIFELYFEKGSGMELQSNPNHIARRNVICTVFNDLSDFLITPLKIQNSQVKIKIWIRDINEIQSDDISYGSSYYNVPENLTIANIADNQLWKTILSGFDAYKNVSQSSVLNNENYYHATFAFKFNGVRWNANLNSPALSNQYDLYTYALREVVHALGFSSLLTNTGSSKLGNQYKYYSRFDSFLKNQNNLSLFSFGNCSSMTDIQFTGNSNELSPNCTNDSFLNNFSNCSSAIKFIGSSVVNLYTPNCFNNLKSLNLTNSSCTVNSNPSLMSDGMGLGITNRKMNIEERNVLKDIGYSFNNTYGNNLNYTFENYNSQAISQSVVGINDGFNSSGNYTYYGNTNESLQITNLLSNDKGNNLHFECLKDLTHSGTIFSTLSGDASTPVNITSSEAGFHLISYVPYNSSTGIRGNITYVFVYFRANCPVTPIECDLILNGGFEINNGLPNLFAQFGTKVCQWESVDATCDYFHANSTFGPTDIPGTITNMNTTSTPNGGNAYVGFIFNRPEAPFFNNGEVMGTTLASPLLANTNYTLTFNIARVNHIAFKSGRPTVQAYLSSTITPVNFSNPGNFINGNLNLAIDPTGILINDDNELTNFNVWDEFSITFNSGAGGQQFLYIGSISNAAFTLTAATNNGQYCIVDNVSLQRVFNPILDIQPETICSNSSTPINLNTMLTNGVPEGVFTGAGVSFNGSTYFFNPSIAGIGTHTITYTIPSTVACPEIVITDTIEVISCQAPYISQVYVGGGKDKAVEIKNASNTQTINAGQYYLVWYDGNGTPANLSTPTASIDLATGGTIAANGVKVFKSPALANPAYIVPTATIFNTFQGYDGIYDVIIISTSNGANAYNDRVDVLGDNTASNLLFKEYTQESYKSLVRMSCTPMGFPRVDYDEQDWVGFNRFGISTVGTYDDSFEVAQGTKTNGELGRHFTEQLTWNTVWDDGGVTISTDESNPDRSREVNILTPYNTGTNGSFEACSLFVNQLTILTISASTNVKVQTRLTIDPNFGRLIVENEGSLVMVRDCYYTPTEGFGCGTELVNLGTNSVLTATKQTVNLSGPYDYVYLSSPLSNNTANPSLNQIFNFGSGTGMFNPTRFYLFQNHKFCDIYKRFSTIVGDTDGYDDNYDDYDPSDTALEQNAYMIPGRGYATWPPGPATAGDYNYTITFTGEMNNGIVSVPVFKNNSLSGRNANLIGNPYPSAIDLDKFFAENNTVIEPIAYIWTRVTTPDDPNSTYEGPNGLNYTAANYSVYTQDMSLNIENNAVFAGGSILASGQSFFVRAYKDFSGFANAPIAAEVAPVNPATIHPQEEIITAGNIQFRNYMRTTEPNITFSRMESSRDNQTNTNQIIGDKLWVNLTDANDFTAQIGIYFKPSGNTGYLPTEDAVTIAGRKYNFYTQSTTEDLLIDVQDAFETSKVIPLGITNITGQNQQFTISIPKKGGVFNSETVYLEDTQLGIVHNLSQSSYSFTSLETIVENRFNLLFSNNVSVSKHKKEESLVKVWISNDKVLKVVSEKNNISSIQVFDIYSMNTDALKHNSININQKEFSLPLNEDTKLYSIRITLEDGTIINKKVAK